MLLRSSSSVLSWRPLRKAGSNFFSTSRNGQSRFFVTDSSRRPSSSNKHDRWWAIGALTFTIPALYYLYNKYTKPKEVKSQAGNRNSRQTVQVDDLKVIQEELTRRMDSNNGVEAAAMAGDSDDLTFPPIYAKYLLIGGGTASFSAAEAILELEPDADVMIIAQEDYPPYLRPPLSKELWFNTDKACMENLSYKDWLGERKKIFFQDPDFYETVDISSPNRSGKPRLLLGRKALDLNISDKTVKLDDGRSIVFEKVLLATGGHPRVLPILAEAPYDVRKSVSTFRTAQDLFVLCNALAPGKHIAIVGGGFLGSELAVALSQFSKTHLNDSLDISQIFPEEGNMALIFPRYLSRWTMSKVKKAGVNVIPNSRISSVSTATDASGKIILSLDSGSQLSVDHVLVAIGIEPNDELGRHSGLEIDQERGGIITNSELQARPDVYAAGDMISFYDESLGIRRRVEHYDHAVLSGKLAGHNMVDSSNSQTYSAQSMFWSDLGPEVGYEAVGLVDSRLTTVGVWAEASTSDSPRGTDLDPSDIRARQVGTIKSRDSEVPPGSGRIASVVPSPAGDKTYGKGVVFYVKDRRIIGMVMFNLFNRIALARDIIEKHRTVEDLEEIVELFNINDH